MVLIKYIHIHVCLFALLLFELVQDNYGYNIVRSIHETRARTKRQSDLVCRSWEFKCSDGESCILYSKRCDGRVDCKDSSDESTVCRTEKCPTLFFRCNYGACIAGKAHCDGKRDCADNSDENNCRGSSTGESSSESQLPGASNCRIFQFACNNGQCIPRSDKCNGAVNCADGSDEIAATCGKEMCPKNSFRCKYGACLSAKAKCNGIKDCADNSDEDSEICNYEYEATITQNPEITNQAEKSSPGSCKIPNAPRHGIMKILGQEADAVPGNYLLNNQVLSYACKVNFVLSGSMYQACTNGNLIQESPKCLPTCPIRVSKTVDFQCMLNKRIVSCDQPIAENTRMVMNCKAHHKRQISRYNFHDTSICRDGKWDTDVIICNPVCGIRPKSKPLVIGGVSTSIELHPWHVGVYRRKQNGVYEHICGGTLINTATVVSAAHCFTIPQNYTKYPAEFFLIAAGKNYRDLDDPKDVETIQKRQVKQILIHEKYRGYVQSYRADVALIRVDDFKLTNNIALICIDWESKYKEEIEDYATVIGWGVTEIGGYLGDSLLKKLKVPIISREECEAKAPADFQAFITFDKYCAGHFNGSSVCTGDSGGGLITVDEHNYHILRGVTSTAPVKENTCDNDQLATYTQISKYLDFIQKSNDWI